MKKFVLIFLNIFITVLLDNPKFCTLRVKILASSKNFRFARIYFREFSLLQIFARIYFRETDQLRYLKKSNGPKMKEKKEPITLDWIQGFKEKFRENFSLRKFVLLMV